MSQSDEDQLARIEQRVLGGNVENQEQQRLDEADYHSQMSLSPMRSRTNERDELHPFSQILTIANVEDCVKLETGAFPPHERCSREKFQYRLTKCPELSLGLFSLPKTSNQEEKPSPTLLAHIVATQTTSETVDDASMDYPKDWQSPDSQLIKEDSKAVGHQVHGKTIAIHSLAVSPAHQRKGLGKTIMRAYIQRMEDSGTADRLSLLAHDHLIPYYEALGFTKQGESKATFGGGGWYDMVYEFKEGGFGSSDDENA